MDLADVLNDLLQHLEDVNWWFTGFEFDPELSKYQKQETMMESLPVAWVYQVGDDDHGFHGSMLFPTEYPDGDGGKLFLKIEFSG